ncbi:hypothetical protein [Rhodoligotrophos ferricapiens]
MDWILRLIVDRGIRELAAIVLLMIAGMVEDLVGNQRSTDHPGGTQQQLG